ncbi:Oxysterol-binding protein [Ceraceosorus bombacis]|uniref:Oxysterol-binding protein n=1 Tax=Ceraceosorus bombacis TaxID=401625 RepID=A0A0P1BKI2_9BASI|nr:Oxysterol-binding protein [Ceraceosorus bombacis]
MPGTSTATTDSASTSATTDATSVGGSQAQSLSKEGSGSNAAAASTAPAEAAGDVSAEELEKAPEAVQMTDEEELTAAGEKDNSEGSKIKTLLGILKRMIGVKDIAAIRLSLPANLLEPVPNLEYWNYLDRGDLFTTIPDFDDPLDRMLATLRFMFTKELKFVRGKICKPYNSILGEHFRCHWDVQIPRITDEGDIVPLQNVSVNEPKPLQQSASTRAFKSTSRVSRQGATETGKSLSPASAGDGGKAASRPGSIRNVSTNTVATSASTVGSTDEGKAKKTLSRFLGRRTTNQSITEASQAAETPAAAAPRIETTDSAGKNQNGDDDDDDDAGSFKTSKSDGPEALPGLSQGQRRITFLTEQVSHHPPISSFFVECKQSGVQLCGVDQLSAKFTGTSVRIFSGDQNQGIFVKLLDNAKGPAGEEYQVEHPTACVNGLLRGSLWVAICDTLSVTCRGGVREGETADEDGRGSGPRLRALCEYKDESWVLKAKYALEGVIYEYDESKGQPATEFDKVRQVPQDRIVATFEGSWKGQITWKKKGDKEPRLLIDLNELEPGQKAVRPLSAQEPYESRNIWEPVTTAILAKDFSAATKHKQEIEQKQRDAAADRKRKDQQFVPRFFDADITDGRPRLTAAGREALDGEGRLEGY